MPVNCPPMWRLGPTMRRALAYIRDHPECSKADVARHLNPDNPRPARYSVDRLVRARLVVDTAQHGAPVRSYRITDAGRNLLILTDDDENNGPPSTDGGPNRPLDE